jgi:DHA1 family multidrug resistance protein-like MFS transporter/DHA1 family quinolone resistance protein-like MFS transporter
MKRIKPIPDPYQSFYGRAGKSAIIFSSAFVAAVGMGIIELGIVFYIKEVFKATPSQIGYFTAIWSLSYVVGCILLRPFFRQVLPRFLIIGSTFFMCLFILLVVFSKNFMTAAVFYNLYGIAMSFFWPPIMGWLSLDIEGSRLGKSMSYFNIAWNVGIIIGPTLAGIFSAINTGLPLYAGSALFILNGFLVTAASFVIPSIRTDKKIDTPDKGDTTRTDTSTILRFSGWVGLFTTFVVIGVIINIFPVFARDELFLRKEVIGLLMLSRSFIAVFVFILMGHNIFWHFKVSPMAVGQVCLAGAVLLMNFVSSVPLLALLISVVGAMRALSYNESVFHGVSGSINRTGRMAIHEALLAGGLIFGPLFGGLIYQKYSMTAVYGFCAVVVMLGVIIQVGLYYILKGKGENDKLNSTN